mmetsp:Transcript_11362/g.17882  ORF Transcript_11362/g.17882 Transcript_11362/m.17882 type:complete len:189 (+) Transcript_11362:60-626(+)|eukprot:CAMPEP_0117047190 /NCGR_PEP_ID=MMETSP0472-20121206/32621_1 /TAXON_ID=693140 ORGANISM="Tiarina fusus, Strain LIS" /NCGR_SAMPLE_ID=MMETSP0472 /ASSEMBLY_ACC=CAM_ASM_000603 /LENGTH=188 /DNA_ID=CAMNT_0004759813 /DNA_START=60 /DNA_END=626 /DNA_ORIENTATION=+
MFLSRVATPLARSAARQSGFASRSFSTTTIQEALTAEDARKVSGYNDIDYSINEDSPVIDAVQKFAAYNIGCLVTTDAEGNLSGVVSERDYITKIALLGRTSQDTTVKQIATTSSKLVTAKLDDSVEACMNKMLASDIRHLPLVNEAGELKGMISIKDLVKTAIHEKEQMIKVISDFALGKGGHFGSE